MAYGRSPNATGRELCSNQGSPSYGSSTVGSTHGTG